MAEGGIGGSNWAPAAWLVGERLLPAAAALTPTGATRAGSHQLRRRFHYDPQQWRSGNGALLRPRVTTARGTV